MKKTSLVLLLSITTVTLFAQLQKTDSLKLVLKKEKTDSARVMILRELAVAYMAKLQYDSASDVVKEGLALAYRIKYKRGIAALLNSKSAVLSFYGNEPESLKVLIEALAINEELKDYDGIARNLGNVGASYMRVEDYRSALPYFFRAIEAREKADIPTPDKSSMIRRLSLVNIINCYAALKMFDSSKFYAQKLYDEGISSNDPAKVCYGLGYLGATYDAAGESKIALEHYRSSMSYAKLLGVAPQVNLWSAMSVLFNKLGQADSALYYGRLAMTAQLRAKSPGGIASMARFLSKLHKKLNNTDSSLYYLEMATDANDTLIVRQQKSQVANALFNRKLKEEEKEEEALKEKELRKRNLQYAGIALAAVIFIILFFLLSHSVYAGQRLIKFLGILALLIVFEFLNLLLHPYIGKMTHESPVMMLGVMVCLAALLIPLHHKLEHWITHRLVEKNKRIRLAAAKKTIAQLEG